MPAAVHRKRSFFEDPQSFSPKTKRVRFEHDGTHSHFPTERDYRPEADDAAHGSSYEEMGGQNAETTSQREFGSAPTSGQSESEEWTEHLVKQMMNASDLNDARARASHALEGVGKLVASRSSEAVSELQKENTELREKLQVMLRDSHILKRAVAIQHERQLEHEGRSRELQQGKQVLSQYQEQVRVLELNNYSLKIHLRMAQEGSSMPGRFHPDIY